MVEIKTKIEQIIRVKDNLVLYFWNKNPIPKFWEQKNSIEIPSTDEFVEGDNIVIKIEKINEEIKSEI